MPTNPLPYQCGTPGCTRKFGKPEDLRRHTKDYHSSSRSAPSRPAPSRPAPSRPAPARSAPARPAPNQPTLPYQCRTPGCTRKFAKPEDLHRHTKDVHSPSAPAPSRPAPNQPTLPYQCGTPGCTRKFAKPEDLHRHTKDVHSPPTHSLLRPAPSRPPPSRLPQSRPPPRQPIYNIHHHTVYSPHPSAFPSLAPQDAVSPPDYASAASATQEEMMERVRQLELRQMLIDKSALKVGMHFVELAEDIIRRSMNDRRISFLDYLQQRVEWMSQHNDVCSLAYSAKFRADIEKLLHDFDYNDPIKFQKVFEEDDQIISHLFREVIHSDSGKEEILHLSDEKATGFMDALHKCIMASDDAPFVLPARRLLKNLCAATKDFPPTLFLELDSIDTNRQIGRGGFADIFLGRYQGQDIVLKRLQVYQPEPKEMSKFSKSLLQEVLTWVHLKHIYILPFLGLEEKSFDGYPPCIVTPYMRNGTMNNFVKNRNGMLPDGRVNKLLFETAQGLAYLHSQNIVHGDLRGVNVLIDAGEHAQLADFGLAIVTDATLGTTSTTQRGSLRWMAPELHDYQLEFKRTEASDVYAFACLCIEIYTGEQPFWSIQHDMAVVIQVLDQKRPPRPSSSSPPDGTRAMSDGLWAIVEACWTHKPSDRPDMRKVLEFIKASH